MRERGGGALYTFTKQGVEITHNGERRSVPITWIFGAGHYARTPLIEDRGQWIEHRLSWYAEIGKLSLTPGHSFQPAGDIDSAMGVRQSPINASRCFSCHMTDGRPGVHCENCHGPQGQHPTAKTIRRDRSVAACASCHRSPSRNFASAIPEAEDPMSVRFAPVGFLVSKCFLRSSGKFTCVSCHDPHTNLAQSPTYDRVCRDCHSAPAAKVANKQPPCPRTADCASCHMPKSTPAPYLTFTDHRIRK